MQLLKGNRRAVAVEAEDVAEVEEVAVVAEAEALMVSLTGTIPQRSGVP